MNEHRMRTGTVAGTETRHIAGIGKGARMGTGTGTETRMGSGRGGRRRGKEAQQTAQEL